MFFLTLLNRYSLPANPAAQAQEAMQLKHSEEDQMHSFIGQMLQQAMLHKANVKYDTENF
ncbi:MAG: hypothetical protein EBX41_04555 [Chitinophagia bacterium]|nr:hypothetical protein [Chitinophagia bacterium]